jgi:hypothetical protein
MIDDDLFDYIDDNAMAAAHRAAARASLMNDSTFSQLCGEILRGASLLTACDLLGLNVREVLAQVEEDPRLLCDLYSAMVLRVHMSERVPAE